MGLNIKTKDGKTGYFDAAAFVRDNVPGATITGYDKETGMVNFKAGDKAGSFNARQMVKDQGAEVVSVGAFNAPEDAIDESPLTWKERFELGYLTRESSDFQRLIAAVGGMFGGSGKVDDKAIAVNERRAIAQLKKRYEDATIANGELVVKHNGVWKKVDSSSDTIGQDAAEFLGNTGLNILGAIAGGAAGAGLGTAGGPLAPLTVPGGAILGAVVGGVGGELAEEATAVAIAGGEVDPAGVARDLMTEATLGLVGEGVSSVVMKGAGKLIGKNADEVARIAQVQKEATVVKGFKKVADEADGQVKDLIAQTYSALNPELSEVSLREAIDSSDNMAKAHQYSLVSRKIKTGEANPLLRRMADNLQTTLETAYDFTTKEFGKVVKKIESSVTDDFKIDLEQHLRDLKAASMDAPRDKRAFFNVLENETADIIARKKANGEELVLSGKEAFSLTQRQYEIIHNKLKTVGAFEKQNMAGAEDRLLFASMEKIRAYLDDKRLWAAEHSGLNDEFSKIKTKYGRVKDALETVWSKSFSNKRDETFAQNVAKGKVDPNVLQALLGSSEAPGLAQLVPEAKVASTISEMRLMQAGIEMTPVFRVPDLLRSVGATGAAATGGVPGLVGAATVVSPRFASRSARVAARGSELLTKNQILAQLPQARAQARSLLGMAYSAGFTRSIGQAGARAMLQDPELFQEWLRSAGALSRDMANASEDKVVDAAIRKVQQEQAQP